MVRAPRFLAVLALFAVGCGENKRDVFLKGLEIEGAAERGPCRLHYQSSTQPAALSGDTVQECLELTEQALREYDKAASLGLKDPEFVSVHDRAKERKARLEAMLKTVRMMERGQTPGQ